MRIVISLVPIAFSSDYVAQYINSGVLFGFFKSCPKFIHNFIKTQAFLMKILLILIKIVMIYIIKIYLDETRTKVINAYSG